MMKLETKLQVITDEGEDLAQICELALGGFIGIYGYPARRLYIDMVFKDRTDDEAEVSVKHIEIQITSEQHELQELLVKMLLGMIFTYVSEDSVKITHTYLADKGE